MKLARGLLLLIMYVCMRCIWKVECMDTDVLVKKSFDPFLSNGFFTAIEFHPEMIVSDRPTPYCEIQYSFEMPVIVSSRRFP